MLQAAFLDCQFLDVCPFSVDEFVATKVDIGWRDIVEALMISLMVVILDESADLLFEIPWQIGVFQQDAFFIV